MDHCPYCSRTTTRYADGGCANRACSNFRLAIGTEVACSLKGVVVRTHDAHGLSYDVRLDDGTLVTYVPETSLAER